MTLIDQIRDLIAAGETERSLEELYKYVKEHNADVIDNLVLLKNRMRNLERAHSSGIMDDQSAALERAKINDAILKLLPQLTPEYLAKISASSSRVVHGAAASAPAAAPKSRKNILLYGGIGLAALVLLIVLIRALGGGGDYDDYPTLLDYVLETHEGQAVWQAEYNESAGGDIYFFMVSEEDRWVEYNNGEPAFDFITYSHADDNVTLYDDERDLYLRLELNHAYARYGDAGEWRRIYTGEWITPE
jgi:hypothetical protein